MTVSFDQDALQKEIELSAKKAGNIILSATDFNIKEKSGRRDIVTSIDIQIQKLLMEEMLDLVPGCRFFCEEDTSFDPEYLITGPEEIDNGVCFIIDPIDGTSNFVHGHRHSCTSIAMAVDGQVCLGVIYDPFRDELFSAGKGTGCFLNGEKLPVFDDESDTGIAVFGTSPYDESNNALTFNLARQLYEMAADVRRTGSAALDCCWTACGRFTLFTELSLSPWDYAAGSLIASETGCLVSDIKGAPLSIKRKSSVLIGRPSAVKRFLDSTCNSI
ncbi:MAG: inositol monophosphatase [Firmicutes bacterium]|nr:inositol monophosphatase [Bacillota bacterium]